MAKRQQTIQRAKRKRKAAQRAKAEEKARRRTTGTKARKTKPADA